MEKKNQESNEEWAKRKLKEADEADDITVGQYMKMTNEQLYDRFHDIDSDTLKNFVAQISLDREAYEVCAVVKKILEDRGERLD